MRIEYSPLAADNLAEIRQHYLDVGGRTLARRMVRGIRSEVAALAEHPNRAPVYELAPGVRRLVVAKGAFLVFYRVTQRIEVIHIRRAERLPYGDGGSVS